MTVIPPRGALAEFAEASFDALRHEILSEKASSLGRAAARAEAAVSRLRAFDGPTEERGTAVRDAAQAVFAYFVQREACGLRRHDEIVRDLAIPREVLVRLGAR